MQQYYVYGITEKEYLQNGSFDEDEIKRILASCYPKDDTPENVIFSYNCKVEKLHDFRGYYIIYFIKDSIIKHLNISVLLKCHLLRTLDKNELLQQKHNMCKVI